MVKTISSDQVILNAKICRMFEYTQPITTSSGVVVGSCIYHGIIVKPDGENDITLDVYDSTTAAGNRLLPSDVIIGATTGLVSIMSEEGLGCDNGIYVDVTCSGTYEYVIYYDAY